MHAALTYYHDHRDEIDREIEFEDAEIRCMAAEDNSPVARKIRDAVTARKRELAGH